jgi:hypothetical protein
MLSIMELRRASFIASFRRGTVAAAKFFLSSFLFFTVAAEIRAIQMEALISDTKIPEDPDVEFVGCMFSKMIPEVAEID